MWDLKNSLKDKGMAFLLKKNNDELCKSLCN